MHDVKKEYKCNPTDGRWHWMVLVSLIAVGCCDSIGGKKTHQKTSGDLLVASGQFLDLSADADSLMWCFAEARPIGAHVMLEEV